MKPKKGMKYENHWGTIVELLDSDRLYSNSGGALYTDVWNVKVLKTGQPRFEQGIDYIVTERSLAEEGFKPMKMYGTKLWKVLNPPERSEDD